MDVRSARLPDRVGAELQQHLRPEAEGVRRTGLCRGEKMQAMGMPANSKRMLPATLLQVLATVPMHSLAIQLVTWHKCVGSGACPILHPMCAHAPAAGCTTRTSPPEGQRGLGSQAGHHSRDSLGDCAAGGLLAGSCRQRGETDGAPVSGINHQLVRGRLESKCSSLCRGAKPMLPARKPCTRLPLHSPSTPWNSAGALRRQSSITTRSICIASPTGFCWRPAAVLGADLLLSCSGFSIRTLMSRADASSEQQCIFTRLRTTLERHCTCFISCLQQLGGGENTVAAMLANSGMSRVGCRPVPGRDGSFAAAEHPMQQVHTGDSHALEVVDSANRFVVAVAAQAACDLAQVCGRLAEHAVRKDVVALLVHRQELLLKAVQRHQQAAAAAGAGALLSPRHQRLQRPQCELHCGSVGGSGVSAAAHFSVPRLTVAAALCSYQMCYTRVHTGGQLTQLRAVHLARVHRRCI